MVYNDSMSMFVIAGLEKFTNYTLTLLAYNVKYGYISASVQAVENTHPSGELNNIIHTLIYDSC